MRVVAVIPAYPPKCRVGAFLATHELLASLAAAGHQVDVLTRARNEPVFELDGVTVGPGLSRQAIEHAVAVADVVVSHCGDDGAAPAAAARFGKPSVRMVHGWHDNMGERLQGASLAVFNSWAAAAEAAHGGPQIVIRPPLRRIAGEPGDAVTLVNLSWAKGGALFWRLARALPHREFVGVRGGWGKQVIDRAPNVDLVGPVADIGEAFARTRVLLMPSERETWGMVGLEAMSCGIPVIAHPTPGLRESLGDAGIFVDRSDAHGWVDTIEALFGEAEWVRSSAAARARAASAVDDRGRFVEAMELMAA